MIALKQMINVVRLRRHALHRHIRVFSHTSAEERLALFEIARRLPPGARSLEIGSHIGSSALFICAGLSRRGGHLVCVDTWMNETMPDGVMDTYRTFTSNVAPYSRMITPIRKHSSELTTADVGAPLDFVFIDGDHSESAVRNDFEQAASWVRPGGLIAFHDVTGVHPGVSVVIGEAVASRVWVLVNMVDTLVVIQRLE